VSDQIVPIDSSANQKFQVSLSVDGKILQLNLAINFSEMGQMWMLSILDANNNLILSSIPLITGDWPAANILAQYAYLKIGSAFVVNAGQVAADYPTAANLGGDFLLIWSDTAS
jgi:hypothetical protein